MSSDSTIRGVENFIRLELKSLGYFDIQILEETQTIFDVIAEGPLRNIYLKVLIRQASDHKMNLTQEEILEVRKQAESHSKEPWTAILHVNEGGQIADKIIWKNLAKQYA
jgi:hypothetical protein